MVTDLNLAGYPVPSPRPGPISYTATPSTGAQEHGVSIHLSRLEAMIVVRKLLFCAVLGLVAGGLGVPSGAAAGRTDVDAIRSWNERARQAVRANRAGDADAARLYAMVGAAMYDAVNGLAPGRVPRAPALVAGHGPR